MFDIPRFHISSCSNSVQLVVLHPIIRSILFQHYKELIQLISEVEHIEARINKHRRLTIREKKKKNTCARNDSQSYQNSNLSKFKQKRKVTKIRYYIFSLCQGLSPLYPFLLFLLYHVAYQIVCVKKHETFFGSLKCLSIFVVPK